MPRAGHPASRPSGAESESPDEIVCRLCNKAFRAITVRHLRKAHGFRDEHPIWRYERRFGISVPFCREVHRQLKRGLRSAWERRGHHWTQARIVEALRARAARGQSLASSRLPTDLSMAIVRHFHGWDRAVRRAGFDPWAYRLRDRWTVERVRDEIRKRSDTGKALAPSLVEQDDPALCRAGIRLHGNWNNALLACGFDPSQHRRPSKWSLEVAKAWVEKRHAAGRPFTAAHAPVGLFGHVCRELKGGWAAFVTSLGIRYPGQINRRGYWTPERVVAAIRARRRSGQPLNAKAVRREEGGHALVQQARKRFRSWDAALRVAGIDPFAVKLTRRWTRKRVVSAVRARHEAGKPMDRQSVRAEDASLAYAAGARFRGWVGAVVAAGLPRNLVRPPHRSDRLRRAWRERKRHLKARGRHPASGDRDGGDPHATKG